MTSKTVNQARETYEAFNRGDFGAVMKMFDPKLRFSDLESVPGAEQEGDLVSFVEFLRSSGELFLEFHHEPEEFIERGDYLIVPVHQRARGRMSGVPVEAHVVHAWKLQKGKAVELRVFADKATAFRALGLDE
jgi:ketosteroid isomerase-like protein